jgi:hypothetical protein
MYTVDVDREVDSDFFNVSGTVTITNNNPSVTAVIADADDEVWDGSMIDSYDFGGGSVAAGGHVDLPYVFDPFAGEEDGEYTNKALVDLQNRFWDLDTTTDNIGTTEFTDEEDFDFTGDPDSLVDESVLVTDLETPDAGLSIEDGPAYSEAYPFNATGDDTFYIWKNVSASAVGEYNLTDTATADGSDGGQWMSDEKVLTFNFWDITVEKTAEPWWLRAYNWTIEKSVDPTELELSHDGGKANLTYTIDITKYADYDEFAVSGIVNITNNNPYVTAVIAPDVMDKVFNGTEVLGSDNLGSGTIPAGQFEDLDYDIDLDAVPGITYTNKAFVNLTNHEWLLDSSMNEIGLTEFTDEEDFSFTEVNATLDNTANVTEVELVPPEFNATLFWGADGAPPWYVNASKTIVFIKQITEVNGTACNWYDLPNTVTLTEEDTGTIREDDALVEIHVVGETRTQGYWRTHFNTTTEVFDDLTNYGADPIVLGEGDDNITISSYCELFGAFWSNNAFKTDGIKRNSVDQARIILVKQLLAGILNAHAFNWTAESLPTVPMDAPYVDYRGMNIIDAGHKAYSSNSKNEITYIASLIDDWNNSGSNLPFPDDFPYYLGRARPDLAQGVACLGYWDDPSPWN